MRWLTAVGLLITVTTPVVAQKVGDRRFEPATGDYYVWVMNDSLRLVELRVVPPNKVLARLAVSIEPGDVRPFRYRYTVRVQHGTRQPLAYFEVDCPDSSIVVGLTATAVVKGASSRWNHWVIDHTRPRCEFDHREPLAAGGTLDARLETGLLPTIGEARLFGSTPGVSWPTSDPIMENEPAQVAVDAVSGSDGGWTSLPAPVPGREPTTVTSTATGISILRNDLGRACGDLGWISSAAVCGRLRKKLEEATLPVKERNPRNNILIRAALEGFLAELAGQHNPAGNSPVNDAAYGLLKVNAEFVLGLSSRSSR